MAIACPVDLDTLKLIPMQSAPCQQVPPLSTSDPVPVSD
jgi:hypothetical protein